MIALCEKKSSFIQSVTSFFWMNHSFDSFQWKGWSKSELFVQNWIDLVFDFSSKFVLLCSTEEWSNEGMMMSKPSRQARALSLRWAQAFFVCAGCGKRLAGLWLWSGAGRVFFCWADSEGRPTIHQHPLHWQNFPENCPQAGVPWTTH